jgi:hypothetical protein
VWIADAFAGSCALAAEWTGYVSRNALKDNVRWFLFDKKKPHHRVISATVSSVKKHGGDASWGGNALDPKFVYPEGIAGFVTSPSFYASDPVFIKFVHKMKVDFIAFLLWEKFVGQASGDPPERKALYDKLVRAKRVVRIVVPGKEARIGQHGQLVWFVVFKSTRARDLWMPGEKAEKE